MVLSIKNVKVVFYPCRFMRYKEGVDKEIDFIGAVHQLIVHKEEPIINIGLDADFETHELFNRAFG